jgi:DNA-binding response OmpR family regulator
MRISLVEDDGMIGQGLQTALRQGGFAVDWTRDEPSAAYALQSTAFDLRDELSGT